MCRHFWLWRPVCVRGVGIVGEDHVGTFRGPRRSGWRARRDGRSRARSRMSESLLRAAALECGILPAQLPMSDVDWLALWAEFAQATDNKQLEVAERIVYLDGRWDFTELSSSKLIAPRDRSSGSELKEDRKGTVSGNLREPRKSPQRRLSASDNIPIRATSRLCSSAARPANQRRVPSRGAVLRRPVKLGPDRADGLAS